MSRFTLKDLESLTGIKSDTIRIWERRYRLLSPHITKTGRRWYEDDDLRRLLNIAVLHNNGVKISRIAGMNKTEIESGTMTFSEGSRKPENIIASLIIAMNTLDETAVNELLMKSVINRGFERTFTEIIFPFLNKMGILWQTGSINAATEHFISGIFRQKLFSAIDSLPADREKDAKRVLMFLPEGEFHEMGLLFFFYFIRKNGHTVLYLGQSVPYESVLETAKKWKPDIVVTGNLTGLNLKDTRGYLKKLSADLRNQLIYAGGVMAEPAEKLKLKNIKPLHVPDDLDFLR
jgi:methanogenic corrinoid protein MtbC1